MIKILKLLFLLLSIQSYSQNNLIKIDTIKYESKLKAIWRNEISNTLLIGTNYQGNDTSSTKKVSRCYGEFGYHKTSIYYGRHGPSMLTYGISTLISLDKDKIVGFRAGVWTSYLFAAGLHITYYTNFRKGNLRVTPELGFGLGGLKFAVGYNIPTFRNKDFESLRYANLQATINYLIKIRTIKETKG